ncbi:hypothetical protein GCM10011490_23090 [Pseudoclavibacter endophyticus]|uniref:Uncharacterized protein n=1 Tax=Pseudoclavibacter endophyticus TaxID=1778590 RepID=A0A6H9WCC7_9MICO|nr:hypothetical protein [Pseudoclavibacter endophyticus]KAB1648333.1 hypothetical protein F8O04_11585 [Pseudoclavibacter endophyticus]GGA71746.1 hypothetical protein GCM10011490_23090 [Pseudoclavibacter endophyticus]
MDFLANAIWSVTPTILIGGLFWVILRYTINADRTERRTHAKIEREERERLGLAGEGSPTVDSSPS